jgi:hypothetical protein
MSGDPAEPMDDSDRYALCKHCGWDMEWAECLYLDCEDGQYDAWEYDSINNAPGTYEICRECNGAGGHWYCPNKKCQPTQSTSVGVKDGN